MSDDPSTGMGVRETQHLETDSGRIAADDLFGVLSEAPNRYILYYLIKVDRRVSTNELIEYTVGATGSPPDGQTTGEFRGATRSAIERALPTLDALGLLTYHAGDGVVEPTEKTRIAEPYLALALEDLG